MNGRPTGADLKDGGTPLLAQHDFELTIFVSAVRREGAGAKTLPVEIIHGEPHENWRTAMAAIAATGDASLWRGLYVWTERERVGPSQVAALLATIS